MRQWAKHWFSSGRHRVLPVGQNGHRPTAGDPCPNCGAPGPQPFLREHVNLSPLSVTRFRVVRLRIDFCRACGSLVLGERSSRSGKFRRRRCRGGRWRDGGADQHRLVRWHLQSVVGVQRGQRSLRRLLCGITGSTPGRWPLGDSQGHAPPPVRVLACWCPPGRACHANVLLRVANARPREET